LVRLILQPDGTFLRSETSNGQEIAGLHYHKHNRSYYTINPKTSKREPLGRDLRAAVAAVADVLDGEWWSDDLSMRKPVVEIREKHSQQPIPIQVEHSKERLSDCLSFYLNWETNDEPNSLTPNLIATKRAFAKSIKCVGNLPVNQITNDDFLKWQKHINKTYKNATVRTIRNHHSIVHRILSFAKRKNRQWDFPVGLLERSTDWQDDCGTPYREKPINKEPMPVAVFNRCLKQAEQWATIDVDAMPNNTQRHKASRKVARDRQRMGIQWNAMLRLVIHGLATVDLCRIQWSNIIDLDGNAYYDFPREKMKHKTGYAIDRKTPLLPSCIKALKAWRKYELATKYVFRNASKAPFDSSVLSTAFLKLRKAAGFKQWTLKHLRNVGGTLADQNAMSEMVVDRFLGHTLKAARSKYFGSVDPTYLSDLVTKIGAEHFDGEAVTVTK